MLVTHQCVILWSSIFQRNLGREKTVFFGVHRIALRARRDARHIFTMRQYCEVGSCYGPNYPLVMSNIAIENGHRNSGFTQLQNGGSFHSYVNVYQRVCVNSPTKPRFLGWCLLLGGMDLWTLSPHSAFLFATLPGMWKISDVLFHLEGVSNHGISMLCQLSLWSRNINVALFGVSRKLGEGLPT